LPDSARPLSPNRLKLAARLKSLREEAKLSGRSLAAELGWSQAKVSRGERGETLLPVADIARWLRRCGATDSETEYLLELAEDEAVEATTIRRLNRQGHDRHQRNRIERERAAESISVYQPEVVPGLLQTPEYCRDLLLAIGAATVDTVDASVAARVERQRAIAEAGVVFDAVITEPALAWQPGSAAVSRYQLDRLLELLDAPSASLGIVSLNAMRRALTCNAFELLRWPDGSAEVDTEALTVEETVRAPEDVETYAAMFAHQRGHAAYGAEAAAILRRVRANVD
jgi:transcriptional regulator with XRE-family HTH domain